jgi:hypothetical protein
MLSENGASRAKYFKNNKYRKIERQYKDHITGASLPSIQSLKPGVPPPKIAAYTYRSYDRQFAIEDIRFNDRMGEVLWKVHGPEQVYFFTLTTKVLGSGQGICASSHVPDIDVFCGRGGKDVIPLYRDAVGMEPNITSGLLEALGKAYGAMPSAEDFAAYVYAVLGGQSYTRRFWNELETPGPRVPLTKNGATFAKAAKLGRRLIWLHTYAERFRGSGCGDEIRPGAAKIIKGVSDDPAKYPEDYDYDEDKREIVVGDGRLGPVGAEIWEFEVSGLKIVQSWLGYRMKKRGGKKSSPLDDLRPERWTARMSDELLELLWVLEATLAMEPDLEKVLDEVVASPCFTAAELPLPSLSERKAPGPSGGEVIPDLFRGDDEESDDDEEEEEEDEDDS